MTKRKKVSVSASDSDCDDMNSSIKSNKYLTAQESKIFSNNGCIISSQRAKPEVQQTYENELYNEILSEEISDFEHSKRNSKDQNPNSIFEIEELTSDDEIYTFQCPETYKMQTLCNQSIDFTKIKQSIIQDDEPYQLEFLKPKKEVITVAFPKKSSGSSLITLPLKGHIVLHKVTEIPVYNIKNKDDTSLKHKVIFPNNIKVRHPLLGVEWEAHIDLANKSIQKENSLRKKHKKAKKEKFSEKQGIETKNLKTEGKTEDFAITKKRKIT